MNIKSLIAAISVAIIIPQTSFCDVLFSDGFEDDFITSANPTWSWKTDMPVGTGDLYSRSTTQKHSGSYSLRLDFDGRNSFCNRCGSNNAIQKNGYDNSSFFVDSEGNDLSGSPYLLPDANRPMWNKTDNYAKYSVSSLANQDATNDRANVSLSANGLSGDGDFDAGDEIAIALKCGVDGSVGDDIDRRSDCDIAIGYLNGVISDHHPYGGSIFKRMYFYIDADAVVPDNAIKLGYWHDANSNVQVTVIRFTEGERENEVETEGTLDAFETTDEKVSRGQWYYLEEEYKRESSAEANDGEYRVWFAPSGATPTTPDIELTDLDLGQVENGDISIIGNWQHWNDASGYLYIDDIEVSTQRIGQTTQSYKRKSFSASGNCLGVTVDGVAKCLEFGN
jgi:hypothetical protein